ncbi:hypothetical protein ACQPZP_22055 [Spirillospora sp. CA-142024]|uniref:hypothetical protein n=1 Tax=Spirillospora sp. CA-142024 TaxID=3240036 RepID=UPI003D8DF422
MRWRERPDPVVAGPGEAVVAPVVPPLVEREGGTLLVLGGGAKSIGLDAAGLAVARAAQID